MTSHKTIIFDYANFSAILRFGAMNKLSDTSLLNDKQWKSYFLDTMLVSMANYIKVLKGTKIILAMEAKSWRKEYYHLYKANRLAVKEKDEQLELFYEAMNEAESFFRKYTNIKVIRADGAEGDDVIAVLSQKIASNGENVIIVSTDGDYKQLLRFDKIKIFNPIKKIYTVNYDHLEFITKLIKGDSGDNVPSSYPRIKKEILEAIAQDEKYMEKEFILNDKMLADQKRYIANILDVEDIPNDLEDEEYDEIYKLVKEEITSIKGLDKKDPKYIKIKNILKLAKKDNLTESKLSNRIPHFKSCFDRNKKLICLDVDNLPQYVVENIINAYDEDHRATDLKDFLKFARQNKLKEFLFGNEWEILKGVKDF